MTQTKIHNIFIQQGIPFRLEIVWKNDLFAPMDLTNYRANMQVRRDVFDEHEYLSFDLENGISITPLEGRVSLTLSVPFLMTSYFERAMYDLILISPSGVPTKLLKGTFMMEPLITRVDFSPVPDPLPMEFPEQLEIVDIPVTTLVV